MVIKEVTPPIDVPAKFQHLSKFKKINVENLTDGLPLFSYSTELLSSQKKNSLSLLPKIDEEVEIMEVENQYLCPRKKLYCHCHPRWM